MKKTNIILLLAVLAISGAAFAGDTEYAITVSATTSTVVLPPRKPGFRTGLWTTNTVVANGAILQVLSTSQDYLVLIGGTTSATNYPSGKTGQVEVSGTVTAIHCAYFARSAAHVTQEADAGIWYHTGLSATTNGGQYAFSQGQQFRSNEQGPVSVFTDTEVKLNIWDN